MTREWIEQKRAEIKAQQDQYVGLFNQCTGALNMLAALESELSKPDDKKKKK